jgi:hypothetical protein
VRRGGTVLVVEQLAPADPVEAAAVEAFERARDPEHARLLTDGELRGLFDRNGLEVVRARRDAEARAVAAYLDLAACRGEDRERAERLAPHGTKTFEAEVGWYLLRA